jgi:hypothetical protein
LFELCAAALEFHRQPPSKSELSGADVQLRAVR